RGRGTSPDDRAGRAAREPASSRKMRSLVPLPTQSGHRGACGVVHSRGRRRTSFAGIAYDRVIHSFHRQVWNRSSAVPRQSRAVCPFAGMSSRRIVPILTTEVAIDTHRDPLQPPPPVLLTDRPLLGSIL